ncbi:hypothetical protein WMF30_52375 [Sorangium sp. So ce134]
MIDANGKLRSSYWDAGGRIATVEEWNTIDDVQQQIVTRYEHNPLGELLRVTERATTRPRRRTTRSGASWSW